MKFFADFLAKMFGQLLGWGQTQAEKPPTTKDANTPKDVRVALGKSVDDWMRDKDNGNN